MPAYYCVDCGAQGERKRPSPDLKYRCDQHTQEYTNERRRVKLPAVRDITLSCATCFQPFAATTARKKDKDGTWRCPSCMKSKHKRAENARIRAQKEELHSKAIEHALEVQRRGYHFGKCVECRMDDYLGEALLCGDCIALRHVEAERKESYAQGE